MQGFYLNVNHTDEQERWNSGKNQRFERLPFAPELYWVSDWAAKCVWGTLASGNDLEKSQSNSF